MIRNKVSIERQLDERLYQFLIPAEGNWNEVLAFANEIASHATKQIESAPKVAPEAIKEESKAE